MHTEICALNSPDPFKGRQPVAALPTLLISVRGKSARLNDRLLLPSERQAPSGGRGPSPRLCSRPGLARAFQHLLRQVMGAQKAVACAAPGTNLQLKVSTSQQEMR